MINSYMEKELERLDYLKKFAQEIQERNDKAIKDGEEAIRHPINAFLLIKGMTADWKKVVKIMQSNSANDIIHNMTRQRSINRINYPTENCIGRSVRRSNWFVTFARYISNEYQGYCRRKNPEFSNRTVALTAGDCFEIGLVAYKADDYYHTIMWMQEARERVEKEIIPTANLEDILEYLAFHYPDHPRAKGNIRWYEDLLKDDGVQHIDMRRDIPPISNMRRENDMQHTYEELCRQKVPVKTKVQSRFYCYYKMDRPYLRLAPFKVEIIRQNPLVVLFHDIISNEESRIIEMLAIPKLKRSLARNPATGKFEVMSGRTSKSARLSPTEHEIVKRIDRRLELATNLEIETAEDLQLLEKYDDSSNSIRQSSSTALNNSSDEAKGAR
ncbi:Prolyl 4-hydroxylase subunit alpha-1 [Dirofilaria immitis]|nr:Prolyl 4-hydroxylase subunit alpha-1 [Dirofilaria immitis]